MKALLDQNLSFRLVEVLLPRFPGSCHVRDVGLTDEDDERIWALAQTGGFVIVTKDHDFLARALVRGQPPQVADLLRARMDDIERFVGENAESVFLLRRAAEGR